jgi:hypothetical protein
VAKKKQAEGMTAPLEDNEAAIIVELEKLGEIEVVRRQSFWDRERLKIRESLARLVCNIMRLADGAASGDWRLSVV